MWLFFTGRYSFWMAQKIEYFTNKDRSFSLLEADLLSLPEGDVLSDKKKVSFDAET